MERQYSEGVGGGTSTLRVLQPRDLPHYLCSCSCSVCSCFGSSAVDAGERKNHPLFCRFGERIAVHAETSPPFPHTRPARAHPHPRVRNRPKILTKLGFRKLDFGNTPPKITGMFGRTPPPLATDNLLENADAGTPPALPVFSRGRQPATFYLC